MTTANENTSASVENAQNYKIQCDVVRVKGEKEGKKYDFLSYTAYDKKGRKSRLKFTKTARNIPDKEGIYVLEIEPKDINRDKTTKYNEYWVRNVVSYSVYDGFTQDDEELPF